MIKIRLSSIMGDQRINQAELARKSGVRPATINEYYHELVDLVNLNYLSRICAVRDCEIGDLLEYVPGEREDTTKRRRPQPRKKAQN